MRQTFVGPAEVITSSISPQDNRPFNDWGEPVFPVKQTDNGSPWVIQKSELGILKDMAIIQQGPPVSIIRDVTGTPAEVKEKSNRALTNEIYPFI